MMTLPVFDERAEVVYHRAHSKTNCTVETEGTRLGDKPGAEDDVARSVSGLEKPLWVQDEKRRSSVRLMLRSRMEALPCRASGLSQGCFAPFL